MCVCVCVSMCVCTYERQSPQVLSSDRIAVLVVHGSEHMAQPALRDENVEILGRKGGKGRE